MLTSYKNSLKPREFAVIDLGSNSFHMIIARVVDGAMQILSRLKQRVHLVDGLDSNNILSLSAIERGLKCLALFAERLKGFSSESVTIIGTHTLRQASNAQYFIDRAFNVIPYPIDVISGHEEARLIFMGVEHTHTEKGRKLVIDIGGGSTELIIGENFHPKLIESLCIGCVSFAKHYFPSEKINKKNFDLAYFATINELKKVTYPYLLMGWEYALGTSGTIKTICEVLHAMGEQDKFITPQRLQKLYNEIIKHKSLKLLKRIGLSEERQKVFVPGLAILCGICDSFKIKELHFSESALREGVLYEIEEHFGHKNIRNRTAKSLARQYSIDIDQAFRVLITTKYLYKQWQIQNKQQAKANIQLVCLLKWAAKLHEVGLIINQNGMQRHSAYILQHTNLPGFNQDQQILLATFVRYHRKTVKNEEISRLILFKRKEFLPLLFLLRLGTLLNNQRQATNKPSMLRLETNKKRWKLIFPYNYFSQNKLVYLDLKREQSYWNDITGWELLIQEEDYSF